MQVLKSVLQKATVASLVMVPGFALAQATAPDVSSVVDAIEAVAAPVAAIGSAVLLVLVGIKVFKWVRRAM